MAHANGPTRLARLADFSFVYRAASVGLGAAVLWPLWRLARDGVSPVFPAWVFLSALGAAGVHALRATSYAPRTRIGFWYAAASGDLAISAAFTALAAALLAQEAGMQRLVLDVTRAEAPILLAIASLVAAGGSLAVAVALPSRAGQISPQGPARNERTHVGG